MNEETLPTPADGGKPARVKRTRAEWMSLWQIPQKRISIRTSFSLRSRRSKEKGTSGAPADKAA